MSFTSTDNKGVHISFGNGVVVSAQWGYGNYCQNRDDVRLNNARDRRSVKSDTCEIAIWVEPTGRWITKYCPVLFDQRRNNNGYDVSGWHTADDYLRVLKWAKNLSAERINKMLQQED